MENINKYIDYNLCEHLINENLLKIEHFEILYKKIKDDLFKNQKYKNFIIKCLDNNIINKIILEEYYFDIIIFTEKYFEIDCIDCIFPENKFIEFLPKLLKLPFEKNQINMLILKSIYYDYLENVFDFLYKTWLTDDETIKFFFDNAEKYICFRYVFTYHEYTDFVKYSLNNNLINDKILSEFSGYIYI